MYTVMTIFVFLHFLSWAAVFGMWLAAAKTRQPNKGMSHAAMAAPLFGLIAALIGIFNDFGIDHVSVGIKLVISILIAIAAVTAVKKQENTPSVLWFIIPLGIIVNMLVAMF